MTADAGAGADVTRISAHVTINGSPLPAELTNNLLEIRVELGVRQVSRATLTFRDPGFTLLTGHAAKFKPEGKVVISARGSSGPIFTGTTTGLQVDRILPGDPTLTLVAEDGLAALAFRQEPVVKAKITLSHLVTTLAQSVGLTAHVSGLPADPHDHVLVAEPPLRFLDRLAELYGVDWWGDDNTLHVAPAPSSGSAVEVPLGQVIQLSLESRTTGPGPVTVRGWDPLQKTDLVGTSSGDTTDRPTNGLDTGSEEELERKRPFTARGPGLVSHTEVGTHAKSIAAAARRDRAELRLETAWLRPELKPRDSLKLTEAGPLSGGYPITAVTHLWGPHGGRTRIVAGPRRPTGLAATLAAGAGGAAAVPAGGLSGVLLVGLVSSLNDPEKAGRVKVKLPTLGDSVETDWARVVLPSAGNNAGLVVPHQVNDEVLVGFQEGDLQRPVVLGGVHSQKDTPPDATKVVGGEAKVAGLTSRSSHVLVVDDSSTTSKNGLRFEHADKHLVHVTKEGVSITAEQGKPIKLTSGQSSIELDGHGNVTIKGMKVTIEGQQDVEIKGMQVKVNADTSLQMQAQATAELKANATLDVESSGVTTIKGSVVQIN